MKEYLKCAKEMLDFIEKSPSSYHVASNVAAMLEKKHGCFDQEPHHFHVHNGSPSVEALCRDIFN